MRHRRLLLALSAAPLLSACALDFSHEPSAAESSTTSAGPVETIGDEGWPAVMTTTEDPDAETTGASEGTGDPAALVECVHGEREACPYDGPAGTAGVGACTAATRVCAANGTWGPCGGQVVPRAEDCRTQVDESCDGTAGCNGELVWARSFGEKPGGEAGTAVVHGVTVDASGSAWITGQFKKSLRLGDETWEAEGAAYMLAQIDRDGVPGFSFGDEQGEAFGHGRVLATDGAGRIAVGANLQEKLQIHPDGPVYAVDNFAEATVVGVLTTAGEYAWGRSFGSVQYGDVGVSSVGFDATGGLWMAGKFNAEFDVGAPGDPWLLENHGSWDGFLVKMNAGGEVVWADRMGDAEDQTIWDIAVDAEGSVWLVGDFAGAIEFAGGTLYATPGEDAPDMYIVKLDAGGHWQWGRRYGDEHDQRFFSVDLDPSGDAIVAGHYRGTVHNLGDKTLAYAGPDAAAVVAKFASDGEVLWARDWAGDDGCHAYSAAVDGAGQAVAALSLPAGGTVTIDGQAHVNGTSDEATIAIKLDRDGDTVWVSDLLPDHTRMAVGPLGEVLVAGDFTTQASFADASVHLYAGVGDTDIYVAKLRP